MYIRSTYILYIVLSLLPVLLLNWEKKKKTAGRKCTHSAMAIDPSVHVSLVCSDTFVVFRSRKSTKPKTKKKKIDQDLDFSFFFRRFPRSFSHRGHWERERQSVSQKSFVDWLTSSFIIHSSTGAQLRMKRERTKQQLHSTPGIYVELPRVHADLATLAYSFFFFFHFLSFHLHFSRSICQQESLSLLILSLFLFFSFFLVSTLNKYSRSIWHRRNGAFPFGKKHKISFLSFLCFFFRGLTKNQSNRTRKIGMSRMVWFS